MNTITLHEAIQQLLFQAKRAMTALEITEGLNKTKWYVKKDKFPLNSNQISARVDDHQELFVIDRSVSPHLVKLIGYKLEGRIETLSKKRNNAVNVTQPAKKKSFDAIANEETSILILGTLPGDKSLELKEYYGHSRNRFWKIISTITNNSLPLTYSEKKALLMKTKIGIWDVAYNAVRKGSLDNDIQDEVPNDLDGFISKHKKLRIIGFNGAKSEALFDKYFSRQANIRYVSLPSTSPANASIDFETICNRWRQILS